MAKTPAVLAPSLVDRNETIILTKLDAGKPVAQIAEWLAEREEKRIPEGFERAELVRHLEAEIEYLSSSDSEHYADAFGDTDAW